MPTALNEELTRYAYNWSNIGVLFFQNKKDSKVKKKFDILVFVRIWPSHNDFDYLDQFCKELVNQTSVMCKRSSTSKKSCYSLLL